MSRWAQLLWAWLPPLAYAGVIFYLSHQSSPAGQPLPVSDKLLHVIEYAGLGFLLARALTKTHDSNIISRGLRNGFFAVVLASLYGASDEWHQSFIPGRYSELADWFADVAGALVGVCIFYLAGRLRAQTQNISG